METITGRSGGETFTARIEDPVQRPETGHWVCRAALTGFAYETWTCAADTAERARWQMRADIESFFAQHRVETDDPTAALLQEAANRPYADNNDPALHETEVVIRGIRMREAGNPVEVVARIHPAFWGDGHAECHLDIDGIPEDTFRLAGVDFAQAREHAFKIMEVMFELYGIEREVGNEPGNPEPSS